MKYLQKQNQKARKQIQKKKGTNKREVKSQLEYSYNLRSKGKVKRKFKQSLKDH